MSVNSAAQMEVDRVDAYGLDQERSEPDNVDESTSSDTSLPTVRACDLPPLLKLFFQDDLIQPALGLPYIPQPLLEIILEYVGPDPSPPPSPILYARQCHYAGDDCPQVKTEDDLYAHLLKEWRSCSYDKEYGEDEPSLERLIDRLADGKPWQQI